jgi:hypothetical protein
MKTRNILLVNLTKWQESSSEAMLMAVGADASIEKWKLILQLNFHHGYNSNFTLTRQVHICLICSSFAMVRIMYTR